MEVEIYALGISFATENRKIDDIVKGIRFVAAYSREPDQIIWEDNCNVIIISVHQNYPKADA